MNIFALDNSPYKAAEYMHDVHVSKMLLETAQLLSTAHRVLDGELWYDKSKNGRKIKRWRLTGSKEEFLYKATHVNHPSNIWVRENKANYYWTVQHFLALCTEFKYRFGKRHETDIKLKQLGSIAAPANIPNSCDLTPFAIAIKDTQWHRENPVEAYRAYYRGEKLSWMQMGKPRHAKWTNRDRPKWLDE
jgi:hypothetical protein